jgi:predicted nucleotide-binding protein
MALKDFIVDDLGLHYEEFDKEPPAGKLLSNRLDEMVEKCRFAFLVMTAEDERLDGKVQARQNVVHEFGRCQERYGSERAIILLEEGCERFSNTQGIVHIQFPKGNILAKKDDIRRVLEREGILSNQADPGQG